MGNPQTHEHGLKCMLRKLQKKRNPEMIKGDQRGCYSGLLLCTVYGQWHGRTSRLQTTTITPRSAQMCLHLCLCDCFCVWQKERERACMCFCETKHACMTVEYAIFHNQTSSCCAQGVWGRSYQVFRITRTLKILFFFFAASLITPTSDIRISGLFVGWIQTYFL